eukprot:Phypoly_transcript_02065.p1 GENE.Phypoly_transcript_02065~~Phypoly_transcript_02065.p1  ORF type:complete len:583 (-),score=82.92 Phypoly_transcript_02065:97-1845(-)
MGFCVYDPDNFAPVERTRRYFVHELLEFLHSINLLCIRLRRGYRNIQSVLAFHAWYLLYSIFKESRRFFLNMIGSRLRFWDFLLMLFHSIVNCLVCLDLVYPPPLDHKGSATMIPTLCALLLVCAQLVCVHKRRERMATNGKDIDTHPSTHTPTHPHENASNGGGCPVDHTAGHTRDNGVSNAVSGGGCPVAHEELASNGGGGCPIGRRPAVGENKGVYYSDYLMLDQLLSLQQPESAKKGKEAHEEHLFIVIHQSYELWFKQILHELDSVIALFSQATLPERVMAIVVNRLERVSSILKILVEQVAVLETMNPLDFLEFREGLSPASGFQSVQFRVLENKLGMHQESRIQYQQTHYHTFFAEHHQKQLKDSESCESLLSLIIKWLERMPFLQFHDFDFWKSYKAAAEKIAENDRKSVEEDHTLSAELREVHLKELKKNEESFATLFNEQKYEERRERGDVRFTYRAMQAALFICLYKNEPLCHMPHRLLTLLMDIDELLALWRYRHALMVQRMIGVKIGTGGSSGYHYLRSTVSDKYKIFIDLYNLASYFIPPHTLPRLPRNIQKNMDFVWSLNQDAPVSP